MEFLLPYRCPSDYDDVLCGGGTGQNTCNGDSGGFNRACFDALAMRCKPGLCSGQRLALRHSHPISPASRPAHSPPVAWPPPCLVLGHAPFCCALLTPLVHAAHLPAGGPLIWRNAEGKPVVVGVTSHGPDCQSQPNNPNYAYGFYTGEWVPWRLELAVCVCHAGPWVAAATAAWSSRECLRLPVSTA